jgi:ABC-type sugar transport system ATPase subunit
MTMADRIVLMEAGRIRQMGTPMELYHRPKDLFVAGFLGSPPMNFLSGRLRTGDQGREFAAPGLAVAMPDVSTPDGPATLGIRPEDLTTASGERGPGLMLSGTVTHVEHLGAETLVEFSTGEAGTQRLIARLAGTRPVATRDRIEMHAGLGSLRLFGEDGGTIQLSTASTDEQIAASPLARSQAA